MLYFLALLFHHHSVYNIKELTDHGQTNRYVHTHVIGALLIVSR